MSIDLTSAATRRIAQQVIDNDALGLRFSVKESGCSGYSYVMDFAQEINESDTVFEKQAEGAQVKVIVDSISLPLLKGTLIDYVSEGLNQTFKFSNPKATDHCGCGESFSIE